ncbi:MAG: hypothetical protein WBB46_09415 [Candidatus Deferrimicrobiaceae bacterium]
MKKGPGKPMSGQIAEGWKKALMNEVEGREFYRMAATEKIVDDLIAWEREHLEILTRQYEQLREMYWEEARFWPF